MSATSFTDFIPLYVRTEDDIRSDMDADANAGLLPSDPDYVDTRELSFFNMVTQPFVAEAARIHDYIATLPAISFIQFAFGVYLDYHGQAMNLPRNPATYAVGTAVFTGTVGASVSINTQISTVQTDPSVPPIYFQVTATGTINGPIAAVGAPTATVNANGSLPSGSRYYVVTVVDAAGESLPSPELHVTIPSGDNGTGEAILTWPAGGTGTLSYNVYVGTASGAENEVYNVDVNGLVDTGQLAWTSGTPPTANTTGGGVSLPIQAMASGAGSNVDQDSLTIMVTYNPAITTVTNPEPVNTGQDVENDASFQERLLEAQEGEGPGDANDYVRWALQYPGVGQAQCLPLFNGPGTVGLVVMAADGSALPNTIVAGLQAQLDPYPGKGGGTAPIDHIVTVMTSTDIPINVAAAVTFRQGYSYDGVDGTQAIRTAITAVFDNYFQNLAVGETVYLAHIEALFFQVDGVLTVSVTAPTTDTAISLSTIPPQKAQLGTITLS